MAWVPSKHPRLGHNFDHVPDPPLERFIAGAWGVVVTAVVLLVIAAVIVWAVRTLF